MRPTFVDVDLSVVRRNVEALGHLVAPAQIMAVVKADAYGHGANPVAHAAVAGGATWLGVATVTEGQALRSDEIRVPILVLSEVHLDDVDHLVEAQLTPTVYSPAMVDRLDQAAAGARSRVAVHVKIDTGMGRVGVSPNDLPQLLQTIQEARHLDIGGVFTHFACADRPNLDHPDLDTTTAQLRLFTELLAEHPALLADGVLRHAANSAAAISRPDTTFDLVRCGIALYGIAPSDHLPLPPDILPALTLRSEVSFVKRVSAGTPVSYGHTWTAPRDTVVVTVPIGYADGLPRRLGAVGGEVLVGGRRCAIAGSVTMDQVLVDVGPDGAAVGDEVVLIGEQGREAITSNEVAQRLDTIGYEIVARLGHRMPRRYRGETSDDTHG